MGKLFENSIITTAGFQFQSDKPLDDRIAVESQADLNNLIPYEGLWVYVKAIDKYFYYTSTNGWIDFNNLISNALRDAKAYTDETKEDILVLTTLFEERLNDIDENVNKNDTAIQALERLISWQDYL